MFFKLQPGLTAVRLVEFGSLCIAVSLCAVGQPLKGTLGQEEHPFSCAFLMPTDGLTALVAILS